METNPPKREKLKLFGLDVDDPKTIKTLFWLVVKIWGLSAIALLIFLKGKPADRGQFGDMFGMVNALFSGLAFAGIIYTILLQREELGEQKEQLELNRQELELTREEMKLARGEYEQQNTTLKTQRFENTFFKLVDAHTHLVTNFSVVIRMHISSFANQILEDQGIKASQQNEVGRAHLKHFLSRVIGALRKTENRSTLYFNYETVYEKHPEMELYFKSIFTILNYVNQTDLVSKVEKELYIDIMRAQLMDLEKKLLLYHVMAFADTTDGKALQMLVLKYKIIDIYRVQMIQDSNSPYLEELMLEMQKITIKD